MSSTNQKGQTLIIMFFIMVIALSIGISISNRFVKQTRSTTESVQSERAKSVAESLIESLLVLDVNDLEQYIISGDCEGNCYLELTNVDGTTDFANATLTYAGDSVEPYLFKMDDSRVFQLYLKDYPADDDIYVCWNNPPSGLQPAIYSSLIYGTEGTYDINVAAYNSSGSTVNNGLANASGANGYDSCFTIVVPANAELLRLMNFYREAKVYVIPQAGNIIPPQGILMTSVGNSGGVTREITVAKTTNVLPAMFDYVIYNKSQNNAFSN